MKWTDLKALKKNAIESNKNSINFIIENGK